VNLSLFYFEKTPRIRCFVEIMIRDMKVSPTFTMLRCFLPVRMHACMPYFYASGNFAFGFGLKSLVQLETF
jgi:hypothetical protein